MMTIAAIVSTMGTARGTTQGSCRPLAARTPTEPSYLAVGCSWEMVAGGLNPTLIVVAYYMISAINPPCHPPIDQSIERGRNKSTQNWDQRHIPEIDILPIRNPTLNTTTPIGNGPQPTFTRSFINPLNKHIVMFTTWYLGSSES